MPATRRSAVQNPEKTHRDNRSSNQNQFNPLSSKQDSQVIYQLIGGRHRHSVPSVNRTREPGDDSLPEPDRLRHGGLQNLAQTREKALVNALFIEGDADCPGKTLPRIVDIQQLAGRHFKATGEVIKADLSRNHSKYGLLHQFFVFFQRFTEEGHIQTAGSVVQGEDPILLPRLVTMLRAAITSPAAVVTVSREVGCRSHSRPEV